MPPPHILRYVVPRPLRSVVAIELRERQLEKVKAVFPYDIYGVLVQACDFSSEPVLAVRIRPRVKEHVVFKKHIEIKAVLLRVFGNELPASAYSEIVLLYVLVAVFFTD